MGWKITSILWDTLWARTEKCIHFHKRFQFINNEANVFGPQKEAGVSMWSFLTTHRYLLEYTPPGCAEIISSIFSCKIGVKPGCVTSSSPRLHKMGTIHHPSRDAPQKANVYLHFHRPETIPCISTLFSLDILQQAICQYENQNNRWSLSGDYSCLGFGGISG